MDNCPLFSPKPPPALYSKDIKTKQPMTITSLPSDVLTVQYDMCGDGSMWEGFAYIVDELPVDGDSMINYARFAGYAPNGCPILEVKFGNLDIAKGFTAVYMGAPDADDQEVLEYLGIYDQEVAA